MFICYCLLTLNLEYIEPLNDLKVLLLDILG